MHDYSRIFWYKFIQVTYRRFFVAFFLALLCTNIMVGMRPAFTLSHDWTWVTINLLLLLKKVVAMVFFYVVFVIITTYITSRRLFRKCQTLATNWNYPLSEIVNAVVELGFEHRMPDYSKYKTAYKFKQFLNAYEHISSEE